MIPRMHHLGHVVLLAVAGAAGTLLRAGCTTLADRLLGQAFPWGTLAVNVAGSFAFGAINALARSRGLLTNPQEVILLVGLFGGFTTYSSFAFQSVEMLAHGRAAAALAYVAATNVAALAAVWTGLRIFGSA
jgi:CrcB protein